jgi:hypothetical protein
VKTALVRAAQLFCCVCVVVLNPALGATTPEENSLRTFSPADLVILTQVGEACLAANREADLKPAIEQLEALAEAKAKIGPIHAEEATRAAIRYLMLWRDYLAQRNAGYSTQAHARIVHIVNLPVGQLITPRSVVYKRSRSTPFEQIDPPTTAPQNIRVINREDGSRDIIWEPGADYEQWQSLKHQLPSGKWETLAHLPPRTNIFRIPPPGSNMLTLAPIDEAFELAAKACLKVKGPEELDPILASLAVFWRASRDNLSSQHRAGLSKIDAALHFVGRWQEALHYRQAGNDAEASTIIASLQESHRLFPLLKWEPRENPGGR